MNEPTVASVLDGYFADGRSLRPAPFFTVWEASEQDVDEVLALILPLVLRRTEPCFVETGFVLEPEELGVGEWRRLNDHLWAAPPHLDPAAFLDSRLHCTFANYLLYQAAEPREIPSLPWWGAAATRRRRQRYSAQALVDGLRLAGVRFGIAV